MKKSILKRILSFTKPYIGYLIFALICAVLSVTLTLFTPILIGDAIDLIVGKNNVDFNGILRILIVLGITVLLSGLFHWIMALCTNQITYRTVRDLRVQAFEKLEKVPLSYIDENAHGDIISRVVNDIDQVSDGLLQGFTQLFTGIVTIVGTLVFMLSVNVTIAIVVVVLTPLSLFVASFIAKRSYQLFSKQSKLRGKIGGYMEEMIGNQKVVKAFSYEKEAQQEFESINNELYQCGVKAQFVSSLTNPCARFVNGLVYAAVSIVGAINAINGRVSIGQLSCFLSYANHYTKPFNEISAVVTELQAAFASAQRVFDIIDQPEEKQDSENAKSNTDVKGNVKIEDVSFSYRTEQKLIEHFNLDVQFGQRIAIVGPTGCGKTTLINLLMRFYEVNQGNIYIDDVNIKDMKRNDLRNLFGMVLQDTWLFEGTVKENIAFGKPNVSEQEIIEAAKSAHAHSFIKRLPHGYDTVISEDGGNISQGQKQLLCIARIMLTKPPILILDEATSNIDTRTEIQIQKAFAKIMEGRTSFIVAHRLSTVKEADCILVMKDGNVIEQGTHDELMKQNGFYTNLYQSQFAKTGE
ncbi:ABC transporter ATP-binding protein [Paludicola sp. MB14-C6]|uniref:ABC transporter ATP-binding protein n=1 Tax=Paludihabitans sp. MB14-C6 TaxID=3070656 RepID=UPI0027DDDC6D|nr:ABC transporter ATP-binding protein [Paludicola sp. MB14-C6]WMJ23902.1 ABC transporter ATP-binding protein [Paludicola sp. MB14-C6]